jgi:hypothetical protein
MRRFASRPALVLDLRAGCVGLALRAESDPTHALAFLPGAWHGRDVDLDPQVPCFEFLANSGHELPS